MVSDVQMSRAIDTVLDRTAAPGPRDVGVRIRRPLFSWPADPPGWRGQAIRVVGMDGRVALAGGAAKPSSGSSASRS